jgi:hypothetical protein
MSLFIDWIGLSARFCFTLHRKRRTTKDQRLPDYFKLCCPFTPERPNFRAGITFHFSAILPYIHIMANAVPRKKLAETAVLKYDDIRSQLKTGQLIFCSGGYLFSGIIQKLTKSVWSHVAIIYKDEKLGRVLVLEAEPFVGIRLIPLSKYLYDYKGKNKPYKGMLFVSDLTTPMQEEQLGKAISFGLDELTRPYDNWEIFRIMIRILFRISKREKNRNYICSELVRDAFAEAGVEFPYVDTYISPDAIWRDARVEMKYRLL